MIDSSSTSGTLAIEGFTPYAQVPRWILRAGDSLSHGAVRLYGVIMTYADNDTHAAFPGREKLAQDMGIKARSVSTYIKELEDFGALKVTRRRNKKTGNFYANHYVLVFNSPGAEYCTPPDAADCPITKPTSLTTPTDSFTSSLRDDTQKTLARSEQVQNATNPGNLSGEQRRQLRQALQAVGKKISQGQSFWDDEPQELWWDFLNHMEEALPDTYFNIEDALVNGKWTVGAKVAEPYQAGIELNKIIHTGNM